MSGENDFSISLHRDGEATIVIPVGDIDLVTVDEVRSHVRQAAGEARRVVLDLRQVAFMDSSGLRLLVEAQQSAEQDGFAFAVVRGPASLERLFEVTGLDGRMTVLDDPAQAADGGQAGR
jgi:anti-sigma B factor antagonist